jgi:hypothetical protein
LNNKEEINKIWEKYINTSKSPFEYTYISFDTFKFDNNIKTKIKDVIINNHEFQLDYEFNDKKVNIVDMLFELKDKNSVKDYEFIKELIPYLPKQNTYFNSFYSSYILRWWNEKKDGEILKLILKHKIYNKDELDKVYIRLICCGDVKFLELLSSSAKNLLVTETMLEYALIYKRSEVIVWFNSGNRKKSFDKIKKKQDYNPYNLTNIEPPSYIKNIWNGYTWHNDECDELGVHESLSDFKKVADILKSFNWQIHDLNKLLTYLKCCDKHYNLNSYDVLEYLKITFTDEISKENITKMVEILGKDETWDRIKHKRNEILDKLVE